MCLDLGKLALSANPFYFTNTVYAHSFHTDKVAIDDQVYFPDSRFLDGNHTQSREIIRLPLLQLVAWYEAP